MNNSFVHACARDMLRRPEIAAEKTLPTKVAGLYRLLYGRAPAAEEVALAGQFLGGEPAAAAWEQYAQALLLANEFVFVD
jgi:hypothetical protein